MSIESANQVPAREIYSFGAKYLIATESSGREMRDDASCFLSSIISTINTLAVELDEDDSRLQNSPKAVASMLWGVFHQLGMVKGVVDAMQVDA